jgi:hypothetical protein
MRGQHSSRGARSRFGDGQHPVGRNGRQGRRQACGPSGQGRRRSSQARGRSDPTSTSVTWRPLRSACGSPSRATLTERDGRRLLFQVEADDDYEQVGEAPTNASWSTCRDSWDASPPKSADPRSSRAPCAGPSQGTLRHGVGVNGPSGTAFGTSAADRGHGALRCLSAPRRASRRGRRPHRPVPARSVRASGDRARSWPAWCV